MMTVLLLLPVLLRSRDTGPGEFYKKATCEFKYSYVAFYM